jgi:hypothetical protein
MLLVGGLGFGATTRVAAQADEPDQPAAPSGRESERAVSRATSGPFVGLLPQGMVQLVGLTEYPLTKQSRWFQPDGSAAELEPMLVRRNHLRNRGHQRALSFLVRIQSLPPDASPWPAWKLPPAPEWSAESVVDASGRTIPDCHILAAVLPASLATATLRVGFGMGPWETVLKLNPENGSTGSFSRDDKQRTVTLQQAEEVGQPACASTRVTLRHTVRYPAWELRLAAIDHYGKEHVSSLGGHGGDVSIDMAYFDKLPLSSIKEFHFQLRPYSWVEFKNVSLRAGQKTKVEVVPPAFGP